MEEKKDKIKIITKVLNIIILIATIGIICVAGYIIITDKNSKVKNASKEDSNYLERIDEVVKLLEDKYYGDLDMDKIVEGAIEGIMDNVDDVYTRYVSDEEYNELLTGVDEKYTGLGIHISYDSKTGGIIVTSVMPNSPAEKSGLIPGDIFVEIEGKVCTSSTYYECIDLIKAKEPTKLHIKYLRNGEILEGDFTTEEVKAQSVSYDMLEENIGYIRIYSFDMGTSDEFAQTYKDLMGKNINGLIIDLRNNPGGLVSEVCTILRSILPKGVILKMVYKDGREKVYTNDKNNAIDIPLVVLVNGNSASASEIFAGSVKDFKVGNIVGTTTYGKGIVQSVNKLKMSKGAVYITDAKYYTSSGTEIHESGITPNVEVKAKEEYKSKWYIPFEDDLELKKGLEVLKENIK